MNQISWIFDIAISTPIPIVLEIKVNLDFFFSGNKWLGNKNDWNLFIA